MPDSSVSVDTIVALSSALPTAAALGDLPRAIVRLSGPHALQISTAVFQADTQTLKTAATWRRVPGTLRWRTHMLRGCAYVMRAPRSYTREDVVELHCPAPPGLLAALLPQLIAAGARLAEPGEFTRRAFENGRLSLEQAAAVGALIRAGNAAEARSYAARLIGTETKQRQSLRGELEDLLAQIEVGLDFSEEDVGVLPKNEMLRRLEKLQAALRNAAAGETTPAASALLDAGLPRVVLAGPTNAGKSTLLNALLQRDAAIVNPRRHTTRDTVEARLQLEHPHGSQTCLLIDSAGYGTELAVQLGCAPNAAQGLQQAAWQASVRAIRSADILLLALDSTLDWPAQGDLSLLLAAVREAKPAHLLVLWTKSDLPVAAPQRIEDSLRRQLNQPTLTALVVSAVSGAGLRELRQLLSGHLAALGTQSQDASAAVATAAHAAAGRAADALGRAADALRNGLGEDVIVVEVREALHAFWQAEGVRIRHDAVTEGALDRIFASFCIGK